MNNRLTVLVAGTAPTSLYTFTDAGETITLGTGAIAAGWTGSGTNTVRGANSSVGSIGIDLGDGDDTADVQSVNAPTSLTGGSGTNTVNVSSNAPTNTGNLNGINADLTVTASNGGTDTLNVSNFGATSGDSNVVVGPDAITGFAGPTDNHTINYTTATGGSFTLLHLFGSNSPTLPESFTLQSPGAPFQLDAGGGNDTANVQSLTASAALNMGAGDNAVNVSSDAPAHLGNVDGVAGTLTIDGGLGSNTLEVSDYGKTTGAVNATLTANQITGLAPAAINYRAVGGSFSSIRVDGSNTLSNSFTIDGTLTGSPTTVTGGTADDSFTLGSPTAAVAINGVSGNDTLTGADATNTWSITGERRDRERQRHVHQRREPDRRLGQRRLRVRNRRLAVGRHRRRRRHEHSGLPPVFHPGVRQPWLRYGHGDRRHVFLHRERGGRLGRDQHADRRQSR